MIGGLGRTIGSLFFPPRKSGRKTREDGSSISAEDYSIGPVERTLIRRMLGSEPFIAKRIIQAVQLGIRDPMNVAMPATLPAGYSEEKWYVEIDHTTDVHRLVVSFTAPNDMFSYSHAFITLGNLPEVVRHGIIADGVAIAQRKKRLSHYVDLTSLGYDPLLMGIFYTDETEGKLGLIIDKPDDLMPWPDFEEEILRIHAEACAKAQDT